MIEVIQWATLATCGLIAAARVPSALRGENRSLFYIFFLMTLATLLSIHDPYVAIDQALGGMNYSNLMLRFIIFAAIYFVGIRVTRGFGAQDAYRLITGRVGMMVLLAVSLVLVAVFLLMDTAGSSAGMVAQAHKDPRNAALVEYYGAAGRAYPAYVSLVLLPAMVRAVRSRLPVLVRIAAFLLGSGGVAIALTLLFPVVPPELGPLKYVVNYTAVLCYVVGLALIWVARIRNTRRTAARTSTEK
ncbi:hypothetical protein ACIQCN_10980 [Pseudarthrobacter sp. NPDC092424]|uniref:hypothetical protein n=1 Tax=Pseudarthrobacter sp. NPDC092424 TaxID=3364415 RepID=UPI00381697E3